MGKKSKIGKQRKDKFYQLAKETGYRSRAAFKLIQLNRKFEFLQKSRVCIDLCAAPGGWMQVARQNMPVSSIVIGIDLFPIKPIPGCISLVEDISTDKCRVSISKELKTWKADVILNDGAPNIGTNWLHDAYQQTVLTLSAIKLASQFLKRGGWFVTKIFRSKDYHSLLWVLQQLFKKVHATKPQASRSESAEIFVVCQYYIAPDKVDSKFFDAKYVFSDLDIGPTNKLNILHPERRKLKAEGYVENNYTLHQKLSAEKFIAHPTGIELLQEASEIEIDHPRIEKHSKTTSEVKECCKDIKVLNRKDLKLLLSWWKELHNEFYVKSDEKIDQCSIITTTTNVNNKLKTNQNNIDKSDEEDKEEATIDAVIFELKEERKRELKKKKKKAEKERKKLDEKLNLKMIHKGDEGPRLVECDNMFNLKEIKTREILDKIIDQLPDILADDESLFVDNNTVKLSSNKILYKKGQGYLDNSRLYYKKVISDDESEASSSEASKQFTINEINSEYLNDTEKETNKFIELDNPLLLPELEFSNNKNNKKMNKAKLWFEREAFKTFKKDNSEEECKFQFNEMTHNIKEEVNKTIKGKNRIINQKKIDDSDSDYNVEEEFLSEKWKNNNHGQQQRQQQQQQPLLKEKIHDKRKLNEEDLALETLLVKSKRFRNDIIDSAWNRYAFNDDHLPDWFVQDEEKHMKKEAPVTSKELVDEYKKIITDINARPIKKVMEAKARKKKRALRKLEKAKKKVEALMDNTDISDRERADQIKKLYKQAKRQPTKKITYVVAKKHLAQSRTSRPAGVKGRFKVVDPRMKKDLRSTTNKTARKNAKARNRSC